MFCMKSGREIDLNLKKSVKYWGIKCPCIGDNFMSNFLINFACVRLCIFLLLGLCKPVFAWMDAVQAM